MHKRRIPSLDEIRAANRQRLGKEDQVVEYFKPRQRPRWMAAREYAALPDSVLVRELPFRVRVPGRRTLRPGRCWNGCGVTPHPGASAGTRDLLFDPCRLARQGKQVRS